MGVYAGGPGVGKRTQADMIADSYGFLLLHIGDMVQQESMELTTRGILISTYLRKNERIPAKIFIEMIKESLISHMMLANGFIICDFPYDLQSGMLFEKEICKVTRILYLRGTAITMRERSLNKVHTTQALEILQDQLDRRKKNQDQLDRRKKNQSELVSKLTPTPSPRSTRLVWSQAIGKNDSHPLVRRSRISTIPRRPSGYSLHLQNASQPPSTDYIHQRKAPTTMVVSYMLHTAELQHPGTTKLANVNTRSDQTSEKPQTIYKVSSKVTNNPADISNANESVKNKIGDKGVPPSVKKTPRRSPETKESTHNKTGNKKKLSNNRKILTTIDVAAREKNGQQNDSSEFTNNPRKFYSPDSPMESQTDNKTVSSNVKNKPRRLSTISNLEKKTDSSTITNNPRKQSTVTALAKIETDKKVNKSEKNRNKKGVPSTAKNNPKSLLTDGRSAQSANHPNGRMKTKKSNARRFSQPKMELNPAKSKLQNKNLQKRRESVSSTATLRKSISTRRQSITSSSKSRRSSINSIKGENTRKRDQNTHAQKPRKGRVKSARESFVKKTESGIKLPEPMSLESASPKEEIPVFHKYTIPIDDEDITRLTDRITQFYSENQSILTHYANIITQINVEYQPIVIFESVKKVINEICVEKGLGHLVVPLTNLKRKTLTS